MNSCFIRWPLGCLICLIASCNTKSDSIAPLIITTEDSVAYNMKIKRAIHAIDSLKYFVNDGDLIVRTGIDFTSESLRSLNQRDQTYSHCGIAVKINNQIFVYHALGGEFNPDQKLLLETFEQFADPYNNKGIGIFRYNLQPASIRSVIETAENHRATPVTFDLDFDAKTDNKMYCAEFVVKTYQSGSGGELEFPLSKINDFLFWGVDDLFLHPSCKTISQVVYK